MRASSERSVILATCVLVLLALSCGRQPEFERVAQAAVDAGQRRLAEDFARGYLERVKAGRYEPLGEESTADMRAAVTPDRQKESYEILVTNVGGYESLAYAETWRGRDSGNTIFRFRGRFARGEPEVRVVLDPAGKVGGFWVRPWKDGLE